MPKATKVVVVYHSGFGHTARLAEAAAHGAEEVPNVEVDLIRIEGFATPWNTMEQKLAEADAIIFGCPTYMGSVSAPFKSFMDASVRAWQTGAWRNKLAGAFVCSSNASGDKLQSLIQLAVFSAQHGMIWVGLDVHGNPRGEEEDLNRLGSWLGAMGQTDLRAKNVDVPPSVPTSDMKTSAYLGRRIATCAARWRRGNEGEEAL